MQVRLRHRSSELLMETRSRQQASSDSEQKLKGYGLLFYGGMTALCGGILAESRPAFILVVAPGFIAFVIGLLTLVQRASSKRRALGLGLRRKGR